MADSTDIAAMLHPLAIQAGEMRSARDQHDPLSLVVERLTRLINALEESPPAIDKMNTLQELGFLREHSLTAGLEGFHTAVCAAIEAAMMPGWK